jgi:hypothetical protein
MTKKESKKPGRPRKTIDYKLVWDLASIMCTQEEIAGILKVSVDTLQRSQKFSGMYKKAQETAKSSLRRAQWRAADKGNTGMLIWLGKQYLGQKDKSEQEITGKDGQPMIVQFKRVD